MNAPRNNRGTPSAAPVATAPPPKATSKSEAAYLTEQAANAKTAFTQTLGEITKGVATGISPAKWTEQHPWIMIAGAVVAGFTTACAAVPSKEQAALNRLKKIEESLREPPENHEQPSAQHTEKRGLTALLLTEVIRASTGIIGQLLKAAAQSPPEKSDVPETSDGNGAHEG